jgi:hypothetical protein
MLDVQTPNLITLIIVDPKTWAPMGTILLGPPLPTLLFLSCLLHGHQGCICLPQGAIIWGARKMRHPEMIQMCYLKRGTCGRNHPPTGITSSSHCSGFFCKGPDAWWNWGVPGLNWPMPPKTTLSTTSVEIKPQSCEFLAAGRWMEPHLGPQWEQLVGLLNYTWNTISLI